MLVIKVTPTNLPPQNFSIADAMVQLECISLVKVVLNSKTGLEFFLERDDYIDQFAHGGSLSHSLLLRKVIIYRI